MNRYWSDVARSLTPYVPGEQPRIDGLIKLNTNENPYPPSPRAIAAMRAAAGEGLRLYPDPESVPLREAIARRHGLAPANVFVGNGSDEVLAIAFLALLKHARPILFPDVTYSFYPVYCQLYGIAYETVPLDDRFALRLADYRRPNGGIVFPNPNAPTGRALGRDEIAALAAASPESVVVVDEAYVDFGAESVVPLLAGHDNLLVVQTLSKSRALAGLRVGFALGAPALVEALARVKNSFNSYPLDRVAQAGALAALEDDAYFEETRARIVTTRARMASGLAALGFQVLPSAANFVFARHPAHRGETLAAALRDRRILVRRFSSPRIGDFLRITVGTDEQCTLLLDSLGALVA